MEVAAEPEAAALPLPLALAVADAETDRRSVYRADEALVTQLDEEAATGVYGTVWIGPSDSGGCA